jgi:hypothetical protein
VTDRHTADTINSDALDQLYDRVARAERAVRRAEGSESWMAKHLARQDSRVNGLARDRDRWRNRAERAEAAVVELAQAIRLTREYVGEELLPPVEGWSWYDALRRHAPHELSAPASSGPAATEATEPHTGLVVQPYRNDRGENVWVFRCWGTDDGCDGWLSLDHYSEQSAERARDRHVAEEHGAPGPAATDADPDDPPVQCWHTEADTPCDWDVCNQPERLAAGDYGTDPREQH